jgi:hypothetical protein
MSAIFSEGPKGETLTLRGLVIVACVNPHRLGLSGTHKSQFLIEFHRPPFGNQYMLMKVLVSVLQKLHQCRADTVAVILR